MTRDADLQRIRIRGELERIEGLLSRLGDEEHALERIGLEARSRELQLELRKLERASIQPPWVRIKRRLPAADYLATMTLQIAALILSLRPPAVAVTLGIGWSIVLVAVWMAAAAATVALILGHRPPHIPRTDDHR